MMRVHVTMSAKVERCRADRVADIEIRESEGLGGGAVDRFSSARALAWHLAALESVTEHGEVAATSVWWLLKR